MSADPLEPRDNREGSWRQGSGSGGPRPVVILAPGHGVPTARSLGRIGVPVHGVFQRPGLPAAASRYWRSTRVWDFYGSTAPASVEWLVALGRELGGGAMLVPNDDRTCLLVADHVADLEAVFSFPVQPDGLARSLVDKATLRDLCARHGVRTPKSVVPRTRDDVIAYADATTYPVVVKGLDGVALEIRGGARMFIAADRIQLMEIVDAIEDWAAPNLLLQEHIPGSDGEVWIFNGYFDAASRCRFGMTGRKIRAYPPYTGMTTLGACKVNMDVAATTIRFLAALGYRGPVDVDYKRDPRTGAYLLLDVNPRLGMTFRLFTDTNGTDVLRAMYRDMLGEPIGASHRFRKNRRWISEARDVASSLRYWRDGLLGPRAWFGTLRGVQETAWWAADDPLPFVRMLEHFLREVGRRLLIRAGRAGRCA